MLLDAEGKVYLIDLATALVRGERPGLLRRRLFRRLRAQDEVGLVRMRARFSGEDPEAIVAALDGPAIRRYRRGRRLKAWWDALRRRRR